MEQPITKSNPPKRNQVSLTLSELSQLDQAASYKGFDKRPRYIMYCARRDLDEKERNEIDKLKLRNSELKKENLQLQQIRYELEEKLEGINNAKKT